MTNFIIALFLGICFGAILNKARLTRYSTISNAFRFTDQTVLKFILTAIVVSAAGVYALRGLGLVTFPNIPATYIVGNVVGGLIFGVGMSWIGI